METSSDRSRGSAVEAIELDRLGVPMAANPAHEAIEIILISARDGAGTTGYGEIAAAPGRFALARSMGACAIGRDPYQLAQLRADWEVAGRPASDEARAVSGGIETALADLRARQAGVPLFVMLGGRRVDRIPIVRRLHPGTDPVGMAGQALELAHQGFATFVVANGGRTGNDMACLRALRRQLGPEANLRVDLAGRASVACARSLVAGCADLWPEMIVDPADTLAGLARLRQQARVPVAAAVPARDVPGLAEAVRAEALDIWIADPLDLGGPAAWGRAAAVCRTFGLDVALDSRRRTEIGAALALHLAAAYRVVNRALELAPELSAGNGVLAAGLRIADGHCAVPDGPGLGIDPDPAKIRAARVENVVLSGGAA